MAKKKPVAELYRAHSWSLAASPPNNKPTERQPHLFYKAADIDALVDQQNQLIAMLQRDLARYRPAGCKLASAAMCVVGEYDGLHRLSLAVADWAIAVASEGDRPHD